MQAESGMMTAETGTYRWMAPEVFDIIIVIILLLLLMFCCLGLVLLSLFIGKGPQIMV